MLRLSKLKGWLKMYNKLKGIFVFSIVLILIFSVYPSSAFADNIIIKLTGHDDLCELCVYNESVLEKLDLAGIRSESIVDYDAYPFFSEDITKSVFSKCEEYKFLKFWAERKYGKDAFVMITDQTCTGQLCVDENEIHKTFEAYCKPGQHMGPMTFIYKW